MPGKPKTLTAAQKRFFEDEGYLVVPEVLDPSAAFEPVFQEYQQVLDRVADRLQSAGRLGSTYPDLPLGQRLIQICRESGCNFPQVFDISIVPGAKAEIEGLPPVHTGPAVFRLLVNPALLDLVEQLVGPEIYSNPVQHVRIKLPQSAIQGDQTSQLLIRTPWHQDNGVILPEADQASILTVWLPLTSATTLNSCMQVLPGSHRQGLLQHCATDKGLTIPEQLLDLEKAVTLPMEPGSVLLMHQRTAHRSLDNLSQDQLRISLDLRYQPVGQPSGRPLLAGAGFVARSQAHPETVLTNPADWKRRWEEVCEQLDQSGRSGYGLFHRWQAETSLCA